MIELVAKGGNTGNGSDAGQSDEVIDLTPRGEMRLNIDDDDIDKNLTSPRSLASMTDRRKTIRKFDPMSGKEWDAGTQAKFAALAAFDDVKKKPARKNWRRLSSRMSTRIELGSANRTNSITKQLPKRRSESEGDSKNLVEG